MRFNVFEFDVDSRELRRQGVRVTLGEQPTQVLQRLLERHGELVTREELRAILWPDQTFIDDFDQGLNAAVKRLRDALGDSADTPQFIETVPRRGYRFIGRVEEPDPVQADAVLSSTEPTRHPRTSSRTLWVAGGTCAGGSWRAIDPDLADASVDFGAPRRGCTAAACHPPDDVGRCRVLRGVLAGRSCDCVFMER